MNKQKGISTLILIIIIIAAVVIAVGGVLAYQYFSAKTQPVVQTQKNQNTTDQTLQKPNFLLSIVNKNVEIRDKNTGSLIQKITLSNLVTYEPNYINMPISDIVSLTEDINFDGYNDLMVLSQIPADNPGFYNYFLYNPSTKKFEADTSLKNLCNPSFNPTTKTISTHANGGCAGENFSEQTFSFINGDYALTQTKVGNCCTLGDNSAGKPGVTVDNFGNGKIISTTQESCPPQQ